MAGLGPPWHGDIVVPAMGAAHDLWGGSLTMVGTGKGGVRSYGEWKRGDVGSRGKHGELQENDRKWGSHREPEEF